MLSRYQELFKAPGSLHFAVAGLVARLSLPMMGIGVITLISQLNASYSLAGAVSAMFVLTYALLSPQISRLVDKYGQSKVLPIAMAISVTGILFIALSSWLQLPNFSLFMGAFLAGFMPSMSAMIRARWAILYKGQRVLQTAYSLETVFDDLTFIIGPPISVGLAVILFPQAGILVAAALLLIGVISLLFERNSEPKVVKSTDVKPTHTSILSINSLVLLVILMISLGTIVGAVDILSVTLAQLQGQPAAASIVLSAYAVGSCVMGLIFGVLTFKAPFPRLLLFSGALTLLSILPLLWVTGIPSLALVVFISGLFFAPTMIIAMSLVENIVPTHQITEGMTWLLAGLNIGVALGAALSGKVVDSFGIHMGYWVAIGGGLFVLFAVVTSFFQLQSNNSSMLKRAE